MRHPVRFIGLLLLLGWGAASAQSRLPACPAKGYFHNCFGTYTLANGDKYVGEFKDDKPNGKGTYTWADGAKYVGGYKDNKRNGQGTFTLDNGDKYVGEWKDDKQNGQGTYTSASGEKYVGEFKDDEYNGQGTYTWADGNKYVGEYKDDKRNGQGIEYLPNGSIRLSGVWSDNRLVLEQQPKEEIRGELQKEYQRCVKAVRVCRGRPDVSLEVLENLSRWLRVARREIQISRTFILEQGSWSCECNAVFSTPAGDYQCSLEQNLAGVVTDASCSR